MERNLSRNPSTTSAAIAGSSSGPAIRTVNCSASISRFILPEHESPASADQTPAHDLDRNGGQNDGEDEDPRNVREHRGRGARGEGPADVDRVVERGEPGDLGHGRREVLDGEEDATEEEERRDDQRKVVRVEVYAFDHTGEERPHDAEHHP